MLRNLPPMNAVRAFEAAARHVSFTKAARELCVTQGAVSRQVRHLEEFLEEDLFRRGNNQLEMTEAGRAFSAVASLCLAEIDRISGVLRSGRKTVALQAAPTYGVRWLLPRLNDFAERFPEIELRVTTTFFSGSYDPMSFDAGIIYGSGTWPGLQSVRLARECLAPVCAPTFPAIDSFGDLKSHTLLHTTSDRRDWPMWFRCFDSDGRHAQEGPAFETLDMAVRAAEAGFGVALGDLSLISNELSSGKLRLALPFAVNSGRGTYFVCSGENWERRDIMALRDWLHSNSPEMVLDQAGDAVGPGQVATVTMAR